MQEVGWCSLSLKIKRNHDVSAAVKLNRQEEEMLSKRRTKCKSVHYKLAKTLFLKLFFSSSAARLFFFTVGVDLSQTLYFSSLTRIQTVMSFTDEDQAVTEHVHLTNNIIQMKTKII